MEKFKLPIALLAVGFVLIIGGILTTSVKLPSKERTFPQESLVSEKLIRVDVSGAVKTPGVYQFNEGSRIEDALLSAGGISEEANKEYISKYLNMAQKLADGTKIYIPFEGEQPARRSFSEGGGSAAGGVGGVNINTASQSELEALPGIGPVTASKIISDRPYQSLEDLLNKKVVNKTVFEKIKDLVSPY